MAETRANGMVIAVIDDGRVAYVQAYGTRNAKGEPLQTDTVMFSQLRAVSPEGRTAVRPRSGVMIERRMTSNS